MTKKAITKVYLQLLEEYILKTYKVFITLEYSNYQLIIHKFINKSGIKGNGKMALESLKLMLYHTHIDIIKVNVYPIEKNGEIRLGCSTGKNVWKLCRYYFVSLRFDFIHDIDFKNYLRKEMTGEYAIEMRLML